MLLQLIEPQVLDPVAIDLEACYFPCAVTQHLYMMHGPEAGKEVVGACRAQHNIIVFDVGE